MKQNEPDILCEGQFLVVDDDDDIANAVGGMLRNAGAKVETVSSPEAALEAMKQQRTDVVISDLVMHDADGLELMQNVHKLDNTVSVVIMTSHAEPDLAKRAQALGASGFLRKPFKANACVNAASEALNIRRAKLGLESC